MTKSTITREQLIKKAQEQIDFCRHTKITGEGRAHVNQCAALFEIALAAMDSEPVILYRQVNPVNGMKTYWAELDPEEFRHLKQHTDENAEFMTLYRHTQPAPVVPAVSDDMGEIRVGRLPTMNQDDYPGLGDWWVQLRIGEDSDEVLARVYGATPQEANNRAEALACRAAMLNGVKP